MPPDPKRKNYPWFDDYDRWEDEDILDISDGEEGSEEHEINKIGKLREMEVKRAIKMIHRIKDIYDPLIDVIECNKNIIVAAELPGIKGYDIKLKMVGRTLTIGFRCGDTRNIRILKLPKPVDPAPNQSFYKNGALVVEFKKRIRPAGETIIPITNFQ